MNGAGGSAWPTANARPQNDADQNWPERRRIAAEKHGNNGFGLTLGMAATAWPTPMAGTPAQNGNSAAGNLDFSRKAEDLARPMCEAGLTVIGSDTVDRGWPMTEVRSFYDFERSEAPAIITNPPYSEINARDGHGRWLRHTLSLTGWEYCALLLSWDWPAARANGLGALLDAHPFSYCYLMRWKLDFTGEGSPPQRNAWFVWDRRWTGSEPAFRWLDRADARQVEMGL